MTTISNPCKKEFADRPYMKHPCVCEVCNCGRHRCPHQVKQRLPWGPCVMSEYNANYHPHCFESIKAFKPENGLLRSNDPMSEQTTQRVDYKPQPLCPPKRNQKEKYKAPTEPLDHTTNYRNEYTPKLCPPPAACLPPLPKECPAQFEGNPTYRTDYRPWNIPLICRHKADTYKQPGAPFEGLPIYQSDFTPKCDARRPNMKPNAQLTVPDGPIDDTTNYRVDYVPHPMQPRPCKIKDQPYKSRVPFNGLTTVQSDYTPKDFCGQPNFKPQDTLVKSDEPMSDNTTQRVDYPQHHLCPPHMHHPDAYMKPEGIMETGTTYRHDFLPLPVCKPDPVKIPEPPKCPAPFDGTTNYRSNYKPWDLHVNRVKPVNYYKQPDVPMETLTTARAEYVPKSRCISESFKPPPTWHNEGPFDGQTNYRTDYTPKSVACHCPAAYLNKNKISPDGYSFEAEDPCGHEHYKDMLNKEKL